MLDPRARQLLLSALRPPEGFRFDCAVGTTFSLDLIALLTAPLAFVLFDWQDDEGRLTADPGMANADPLALLESLRRCADRIHIYCQAGQIKVPPTNQRLLTYLEQAVIEVQAPVMRQGRSGVFHPKVWAIRYADPAGDKPVQYRLLCLSRNLTFDRCWDTVLVLDGQLTDRQNAFRENRPLADFFADLPALAVRSELLPEAAVADTAQIARELRVVKWELPDGVEEMRFWPMGLNGRGSWPFADRLDRLLIVSPFLTEAFLKDIGLTGREQYLVSRPESLRELDPNTLDGMWKCYTLEDGIESLSPTDAEDRPATTDRLNGMHAKLFVADAGWNAHVWTGSANATTAAFNGNVEFLVELIGKKGKLGVDATIGASDGIANLRSMLTEFTPASAAVKLDPDTLAAEGLIESIRSAISGMRLSAEISTQEGAAPVTTRISSEDTITLMPGVSVRCRPIMLPSSDSKPIEAGMSISVTFGPHSPESISSFVSFEVIAVVGTAERRESFVLNLPLIGAPADRRERLLRDLLRDTRTLLRFLLLLLADDPEHIFEEIRDLAMEPSSLQSRSGWEMLPLVEHMLAALYRSPEKLKQVKRLIDDLRKTPEGRSILPTELEEVWGPISRVQDALAGHQTGGAR